MAIGFIPNQGGISYIPDELGRAPEGVISGEFGEALAKEARPGSVEARMSEGWKTSLSFGGLQWSIDQQQRQETMQTRDVPLSGVE